MFLASAEGGLQLPLLRVFLINYDVYFFNLVSILSWFCYMMVWTVLVLATTYLNPATHIFRSSEVGANRMNFLSIVYKQNGYYQSSGNNPLLIGLSGKYDDVTDLKGIIVFFLSSFSNSSVGLTTKLLSSGLKYLANCFSCVI